MSIRSENATPYLDSEQINAAILVRLQELGALEWNYDASGGLTLRPDVHRLVTHVLCAPEHGWIRAGGLGVPTVTMKPDGTVILTFRNEPRALVLWIINKTVIAYEQHLGSGGVISGTLNLYRSLNDEREVAKLVDWTWGNA